MMKGLPMTVWRRKDDGGIELAVVDLAQDVLFVTEAEDRTLTLHARTGEYRMLTELEQFEQCVSGYCMMDSTNAVNMRHAKHFDPGKLAITFSDGDADGAPAVSASVAAVCKALAREWLH